MSRYIPNLFTGRLGTPALGVALVSAALGGPPAEAAYVVGKHNVLLIIADDVGVDQLSLYVKYYNTTARTDDDIEDAKGTPLRTACTRTIEKLAASGVTFVNAWGYPTCSPTRASMYTGMHAFRTQVYTPQYAGQFCRNTTTIAEVVGAAGYSSGLMGKWHLGGDTSDGYGPTDHGWIYYDNGCIGSHLGTYFDTSYYQPPGYLDTRGGYATFDTAENAKNWINAQTGNWFATVAFNAAHMTDQHPAPGGGVSWSFDGEGPPEGYGWCPYTITSSSTDADIYRATLSVLDRQVGELLDGIRDSTLAKTTIIFVGDNGTDDAILGFSSFAGKAKGTVYEGGVNVPLIIADGYAYRYGKASEYWYGTGRVVSPNRTSTALVQTVDLFATIAEIAGGDGSCGVDAVSLVPLMNNTATSVRSVSYVLTDKDEAVMAEFGGWGIYKLLIKGDGDYELYNLSADRWETQNLLTPPVGAVAISMKYALLNQRNAVIATPATCGTCP